MHTDTQTVIVYNLYNLGQNFVDVDLNIHRQKDEK